MSFRLVAPDISNWLTPTPSGNDESLSDAQMSEASEKYLESLNIPLPSGLFWQGGETGKFIRFIGTYATYTGAVINPDPSNTGTRGGSGTTSYPNQILSELFLPAGYTLKASPTTESRAGAAGGGIPGNRYVETNYSFDLLTREEVSVPYESRIRSPVNRLNNYARATGASLIAYRYSQEYLWWLGFGGYECQVSSSAGNIHNITEEPIIRPDPLPPSPAPPTFPDPPPPPPPPDPPPPPCDISITVDPGFRERGYFCMSNSEYTQLMQRFPQQVNRINTTNNLLRESL